MIAIPRDSYVSIPGHGMNKINSAYAMGTNSAHGDKGAGARLAVQTVQNLTGLTIDHFVQVDLIGFYRISNAIGGVQVNLCAPAKEANSGIDLPAGISTIKGKQALAFVRQRYNFPDGLGDLDRIHRQQYFLSAVFRKLSSAGVILNPIKLQNLLKAVSTSLTMDKTLDPLKLAEQLQNLSAGNLTFTTIPTDGFATEDVGSVVVVHPADVQKRVAQLVAQTNSSPGSTSAAKTVAPSSVTVDVLNGAAADGVATTNAATLRGLGFQVGTDRYHLGERHDGRQVPERHAGAGRDRRGARAGRDAATVQLGAARHARPGRGRSERRGGRYQALDVGYLVVVLVRPDHGRAGGEGLYLLTMNSPEALFAAVLAAQPAQPLVTFYDEARGERSELSARSLGNWVAKTHFLLSDELGLGAGDAAFVDLPAHWISVPGAARLLDGRARGRHRPGPRRGGFRPAIVGQREPRVYRTSSPWLPTRPRSASSARLRTAVAIT